MKKWSEQTSNRKLNWSLSMNQQFERRQMVRALPHAQRVNDARLGMSMKEVFRRWNQIGRDPFGESGFRNRILG